jgi:hypothetical protein
VTCDGRGGHRPGLIRAGPVCGGRGEEGVGARGPQTVAKRPGRQAPARRAASRASRVPSSRPGEKWRRGTEAKRIAGEALRKGTL